jgi:hypothetical protein
MFTFDFCSLEHLAEGAYSLLTLADSSLEQAKYQRKRGMTGSRHRTKNSRKEFPNV